MNEVTLEERMERLEWQNRRLRLAVAGVLAVVVALVCVAATRPAPKVLLAQGFLLVDARGKGRAGLAMLPDGCPALSFLGDKRKGKGGVLLSLLPEGGARLQFLDDKGRGRAGVGLLPDGTPGLALLDAKGKAIWMAP